MSDSRFLSTRQAAKLLGLSLGTVQKMVETGALDAWKTEGGHRRIPAASVERCLAERGRGATPAVAENAALDILIAEDDPIQQTLYTKAMEKWPLPLQVRVADNGFDALIEVGRKSPDVLISDLMMPGMNGFELIRHLRANPATTEMRIIVVTALDADAIRNNGGLPTGVALFPKPIPLPQIRAYLEALSHVRQRTAP